MKFEIKEVSPSSLHESFRDQERYVIVDEEGFDVDGEHYNKETATNFCEQYNKEAKERSVTIE